MPGVIELFPGLKVLLEFLVQPEPAAGKQGVL